MKWLDISDTFTAKAIDRFKAEKRDVFVFEKAGKKIVYKVMRYGKNNKIWVKRIKFMSEDEKHDKINHYGHNVAPSWDLTKGKYYCTDCEEYFHA